MIGAQTGLHGVEGPFKVANIDLSVRNRKWAFADNRQAEIADCFAALKTRNSTLFNGPMLLANHWDIKGDALRCRLFRTDFASFLYWRDRFASAGKGDFCGARNVFGAAAVRSAEGYLLVGQMAPHTANAGRIYGPCGSLDEEDITDGQIDIDGTMARELAEETGLDLGEAEKVPGYLVWFDGPRVAIIGEYRFSADAATLTAQIEAFLAKEAEPELSAIHFLGLGPTSGVLDGIAPADMPGYARAMVRWYFSRA